VSAAETVIEAVKTHASSTVEETDKGVMDKAMNEMGAIDEEEVVLSEAKMARIIHNTEVAAAFHNETDIARVIHAADHQDKLRAGGTEHTTTSKEVVSVVGRDWDHDGKMDTVYIDTTGDGQVDTIAFADRLVPSKLQEGMIQKLAVDTTGDGKIDTIHEDKSRSGKVDTVHVMTVIDGETMHQVSGLQLV
jgi:hypothetical protein